MKKKYHDESIFIIVIIILIGLFIFFISLNKVKYSNFKTFVGVVTDNNKVKFILNDKDIKILQKNNYLYLDNKKKKYDKLSLTRNVIKKDDKNYNEILIRVGLNDKLKVNDYVKISIFDKRKSVYSLFKKIWKE